jgi:hypothetical protein
MISTLDIYWAAGIMEGEGWFGVSRQAGAEKGLAARLTMTDKDVVDRFHSIFTFGTRSERKLPSGKTAYTVAYSNQAKTAGLMMTLLTLMGSRRKAKIIEILESWKARPRAKKHWETCKHGHSLSGSNLKVIVEGIYTKRRCIECARLRQEKYRSNKKDL